MKSIFTPSHVPILCIRTSDALKRSRIGIDAFLECYSTLCEDVMSRIPFSGWRSADRTKCSPATGHPFRFYRSFVIILGDFIMVDDISQHINHIKNIRDMSQNNI